MRFLAGAFAFAVVASASGRAQSAPGQSAGALPEQILSWYTLSAVAITGQQAPGVPPGATFQFFGAAPGFGTPSVPAATIDDQGDLAFAAAVNVPSGGGSTTTQFGIWRRTGGSLGLFALSGDAAPGTSQTFVGFPSIYFGGNPSLVLGRSAFHGGLQAAGSQPTFGVWTDRFGPLALVALNGGVLPGLPPSGTTLTNFGELLGGGLILIHATYHDDDDGGYIDAEQEGFWRDDGQSVVLVIRDDAQAPGCPAGVVFGEANIYAEGSFGHSDADSAGRLAFNGYVKGPGVQLLSDEGVWYEGPGGLTLIAREGSPAPAAGPGISFGEGAGLHSFGNLPVAINDNGSVLFGAGLMGNGFNYGESLWVLRNGQLECIVKAGSGSTGGFNPHPAPGFPAGTVFTSVLDGRLNALDQVAVTAAAGGVLGIWRERNGGLELLARAGGRVPGIPGARFTSNYSLVLGELSDDGTLYYDGTFTGPGISYGNEKALFAVDPAGQTRIVVRKGQNVPVGLNDSRVVADFGAGESAGDGEKSLKLVFTDNSNGLFTARLQGP